MKKESNRLACLVATMILGLVFAGCAALQKNDVTDVEGLLTQAGFQKMVADTPEKSAHLKTLPQRKFTRTERHGKTYFVYADDTYCNCLFYGDETAMQHYRDLDIQQNENVRDLDRPEFVTGEEWSRAPWGPFDQ